MKLLTNIFNHILGHLRDFGLLAPLSFDQQVWGAKSVMDLVQHGSKFLLAEADAGGTMYTCWSGSRDQKPYAISVDVNGHATTPVYDDSRIGDCGAWVYPPKLTCAQAQVALVKAGIPDAWTFCRLRQTVDFPQANPFYNFVLSTGKTAHVDANTGQVTPF
jgi:hypothetical protein